MAFLREAAKWYQGESHQDRAWDNLESQIPSFLIDTFKKAYRNSPRPEPTPPPVSDTLGWDKITVLAKQCGAKFPECVAAQWALESGFGQFTSGKNNYFGIKGIGTTKTTWEDYGYGPVTIQASFMDFNTPYDCINYLVTRWYKDYNGYLGVNRAYTREECARLLKSEGYATDPIYSSKLIKLMNSND
jgi:hypothetical protein